MKFLFSCWLMTLVLMLLACANQPPTPTVQPTPTVDPSWTRYTSSDGGYSFAHPNDWMYDAVPGQTVLFDVPERAGFATVLLDSPLSNDRAALGQSLSQRLSAQAERNGDQFKKIAEGDWPQITSPHYSLEHITVEPSQQISTYHVTFLIASPQQQTLFAQYFHLDAQELSPAERQMLIGVITSLQFKLR